MRLQLESTECCNNNAHVASHSFELLGPPGILGLRHSKRSVSSPKCWDMMIETKLKYDQRPSIIRCITPSRPTSNTGCNPPNPKGSDSAVTTPTSPAFVPGGQGKRKIWPFSQGFGEGESEIGGGGGGAGEGATLLIYTFASPACVSHRIVGGLLTCPPECHLWHQPAYYLGGLV